MSQLDFSDKSTTVRSIFSGLQALSPGLAAQLAAAAMFKTQRRRADGWEQALLDRAEELSIDGPSGRISARRWGDAGPLVLLVPGHGRSDGSRSSLLEFANAFDAVLDAVRPFFQPLHGVVAHSMGGAAVTFALSRAQGRGRDAGEPGVLEPRLVFIAPPIDLRDFVDTVSQQFGLLPSTQARLQGLVERRIGKRLEDLHALKLAGSMPQPLLVVHDEQDRAVPFACGASLAQAWPGAELRATRGLGHSRILRDPQVVTAVTEFIRDARPTS
jgi:pimeloyl-ACP methyl ester carboxylesterase